MVTGRRGRRFTVFLVGPSVQSGSNN
uniref:Uncharacterized protein n=1 Tax=Arundo donax TaxID=35708 RepID=A0A0A9C8M8_ARUDO